MKLDLFMTAIHAPLLALNVYAAICCPFPLLKIHFAILVVLSAVCIAAGVTASPRKHPKSQ